jgi:quinol monooxygenase YgiN
MSNTDDAAVNDLVPAEVLGSDKPIAVYAVSRVKPGKEGEFEKLVNSVVQLIRAEPGCEQYVVHIGSREPAVYVVYERYPSGADLVKHLEMPFVQAFFAQSAELVAGPPETTWLWPLEA